MKNIILSLIPFMFTFSILSKEITIDMLNKRDDGQRMVYSQDVAKVAVGDAIKWLPTDPGHNVEFLAGPEGFSLPQKSIINREVSLKFEIPGIYLYVCSPHSIMGMIGLVIVGDSLENLDSVKKHKLMGKSKKKFKKLLKNI